LCLGSTRVLPITIAEGFLTRSYGDL
jgi:hypothetical protein